MTKKEMLQEMLANQFISGASDDLRTVINRESKSDIQSIYKEWLVDKDNGYKALKDIGIFVC